MTETRIVAVVGGAAIGAALALAGMAIAGLAGIAVGVLLTVPITMVWGYWWGSRP